MCQNSKKGHNINCHNNCRIHHPNFFNYYQYPIFPSYGCGTPPLIQYLIPQQPYTPLFSQYQYSPIIQYPMSGPQPNQSLPLGQPYQYNPYNVGQNFNNLANNARINDNFQYQPVREDYYLSPYNSRIPLGTELYYNDFRRPISPLSAEEEYNWAVHISDILDEFIGRHRSRPKSNFDEYQNLKQTLDTSLRHLKEAEALNQKLVNAWEKKDKETNPNSADDDTSNDGPMNLPTDNNDSTLLKQKTDQSDALNEKNVSPIIDSSEPEKSSSLTEDNVEDKFNFLDFEEDSVNNFNPEDDAHSFFFKDEEFEEADSPEKKDNDISKNDNDVNNIVAEDIHDFLGVKSPDFDLMESNPEIIETNVLDEELKFVDIDKVKDTKPVFWTYKDYTIKTSLGEKRASEIYPKIFDEYGHLKMDHFEAMAQFGVTEKQYDQLIENFYRAKENKTKKIKKNEFGVVVKSKFNVKAFWITMGILGVILLLIAITVILYFTVPSVAEGINTITAKIKKIF
ncbi:hypothetical protein C6B38_01745 [Spiroplasma sp. ChiS]|uniref:hypothetical protein n=1 Tax=Spiroplasma sp. ChiS TaxID=2099885 RepID=UPI000CF8B1C8|nr:hypothetical protein [Spiroplasma sp. ChiS]PQP79306.1 hypothetical protein C6B38_01745 [Spiroplasma sp. ChiS]